MTPAALFAVCILQGPISWQLNQLSAATDVDLLYDWQLIRGVGPKVCPRQRVSANTALRLLLGDGPYTYDWVNSTSVAVTPVPWCQPERGADAPVPPCRPRIEL